MTNLIFEQELQLLREGRRLDKIKDKFKKWVEKENKKMSKNKTNNTKSSSQSNTISDANKEKSYKIFKEELSDAINTYKEYLNGKREFKDVYFGIWGEMLFYLGITKQQFEKEISKYEKSTELDAEDLVEYMREQESDYNKEEHELIENNANYIEKNKYITIAYNGGGDYVLYFFKDKFFLDWYHEDTPQSDLKNKYGYDIIINSGKKWFFDSTYKEIYIKVDKDLGYNRLSDNPIEIK
jgi:hypothetical protein